MPRCSSARNRARLSGRTSASVGGSAPGARSASVGQTLKSPSTAQGSKASSRARVQSAQPLHPAQLVGEALLAAGIAVRQVDAGDPHPAFGRDLDEARVACPPPRRAAPRPPPRRARGRAPRRRCGRPAARPHAPGSRYPRIRAPGTPPPGTWSPAGTRRSGACRSRKRRRCGTRRRIEFTLKVATSPQLRMPVSADGIDDAKQAPQPQPRDRLRIPDREMRADQRLRPVQLGPGQQVERDRVHEHARRAAVLDRPKTWPPPRRVFQRESVLEAGAAAGADRHAQPARPACPRAPRCPPPAAAARGVTRKLRQVGTIWHGALWRASPWPEDRRPRPVANDRLGRAALRRPGPLVTAHAARPHGPQRRAPAHATRARAPWAVRPEPSRGRLHPEPGGDARSPFQRDRDRIIHSTRLPPAEVQDPGLRLPRGRPLPHPADPSLEVAQIARSIARALGAGRGSGRGPGAGPRPRPPALRPCRRGGAQFADAPLWRLRPQRPEPQGRHPAGAALRRLRRPEPHLGDAGGPGQAQRPAAPPRRRAIADYDRAARLDSRTHASAEAQVAALADDIAYNNHDLDDGIRAGLFTLEEAAALPLIGEAYAEAAQALPGHRRPTGSRHETVRRVISAMVDDVVAETGRRLAALAPRSPTTSAPRGRAGGRLLRRHDRGQPGGARLPVPPHVPPLAGEPRRAEVASASARCCSSSCMAARRCCPRDWAERAGRPGSAERARVVCDYIAGMTDRYALEEHRRLTDPNVPG